jgi:prepilin-type N-terminal cleavage/methylation domain-containing protein
MTARRTGSAGFTLLEMLVALALLAVLTGFLASGLRLASRHLRDWMTQVPVEVGHATVRDFLRRILASAYPAVMAGHQGHLVTFNGAPDRLTLTAAMPNDVLPGGFYRLGLRVEDHRLMLAWAPERNQQEPPIVGRALLDHVAQLRLRYFGATRRDQTPGWSTDWTAQTRLPDLVEVGLSFTDARTESWLPLIAPMHVEDDVGCIFEPAINDCLGR